MTDKIDLLPLPEDYVGDEGLGEKRYGPYSPEQMEDYARANIARAVEPLQAEIEALRAEVERLRADRDSWEQQASDRVADWHAEHLRAEQLAEALRDAREFVAEALSDERAKFAGYEAVSDIAGIEATLQKIDAALGQEE